MPLLAWLRDPPLYVQLDASTLKAGEAFTARQLFNEVIVGSVKREPMDVYQARQQAAKQALHAEREARLLKMTRRDGTARLLQMFRK